MPPPLTPTEKEAERLRLQLANGLQTMRQSLHADVDALILDSIDFLANPLRAVLYQYEGTPAQAVDEWRDRVMVAKQQFLQAIESEFVKLRAPSGEYVQLLRSMTHRLPPPLPPEKEPISFAELDSVDAARPLPENPLSNLTLDQLGLGKEEPF